MDHFEACSETSLASLTPIANSLVGSRGECRWGPRLGRLVQASERGRPSSAQLASYASRSSPHSRVSAGRVDALVTGHGEQLTELSSLCARLKVGNCPSARCARSCPRGYRGTRIGIDSGPRLTRQELCNT
jgi:hypothetical protein